MPRPGRRTAVLPFPNPPTTMKTQPSDPKTSRRLLSLDTLRGFDMLFIMGFAGLVAALCKLCPGGFSDWLAAQMGHAEWDGFFHHDTIFPLFLFIAGVSFPFSLAKQRARGLSDARIAAKVIRRGCGGAPRRCCRRAGRKGMRQGRPRSPRR